jgi:hypothetical protein
MWINNIRAPHFGQDGQAMTRGENPISAIYTPPLAYRCIEIFGRWIDTLTSQWLPLDDIVHRIQNASEMGFNRRKMEDQRRETAEKEAASRRATDAQVLEDAEWLIAAWNERQARQMPMLFSPTIGAVIAAQYWFLWIRCPACQTINAIYLRKLDRHRDAAVTTLIPRVVLSLMPAERTICRTRAAIAHQHRRRDARGASPKGAGRVAAHSAR